MPSLTVVMIVRNEAHCLPTCLASVAPIADAMVIGDTGSTDGTPAIAESFGATVVAVPWEDDFAKARNTVLDAAPGDWLLHLDADEELDPEGAAAIRALVDADGHGADAVELILANYSNDPRAWRWVPAERDNLHTRGKAGYLPVPLLRLFRNGRGFRYEEPVHESITASVQAAGGRIIEGGILIHHHGYDPDDAVKQEKRERYLAIARRKAETRPDDVKALHDLAEQALACGHVDEGEAACRRALARAPGQREASMTLANILLNRGELGEARTLLEALDADPESPPAVQTALGAIALREGRFQDAKSCLLLALAGAPHHLMARLYLARVFDVLGEREHGRRELALARDMAPGMDECRNRLRAHELGEQAERLFQTGFLEEALETLVEALRLDNEDPVLFNDVGVVLFALGRTEEARENFTRALRLAPGFPGAAENLAQTDT